MTTITSTRLYFKSGSSDKEYAADIVQSDRGYFVNFRYGRRGHTLTAGTKTEQPVSFEEAQSIYTKLVASKVSKDYTPNGTDTPYQDSVDSDRATNFIPQLCNPVSDTNALGLIYSPHWAAQEKMDGERRAVDATLQHIIGINRKGLRVPLPQPIVKELYVLVQRHGGIFLDGELVGDVLHVFDLLRHGDLPLHAAPWHQRITLATHLLTGFTSIRVIPVAYSRDDKRALWHQVKDAKGEGIVFKAMNSVVAPGRPNSGGDWLKAKFVESATCCVMEINLGRRSVKLGVMDAHFLGKSRLVPVGNVTIPPNYPVPEAATVVEIQYLYANPGGSLYQPIYRGPRTDVGIEACRLDQLKLKPAQEISPVPA
ncbi:MAG: WGR domain-containing protein [Rhodocyclaceae bacterium]|nr:WGR domain-containing protein [Rhodocyclaceae bacterium]